MGFVDRYGLTSSPLISIDGRGREPVDLQLQALPSAVAGTVLGVVRMPSGEPVPSAAVMLFAGSGEPFEHTNANATGRFVFPQVPVGSYYISATAPGLLTPLRIPITVTRNGATNVTITMQTDPDGGKNAIYGKVRDSVTGQPVPGASVEIERVANGESASVGVVTTNAEGNYLIADLVDGVYVVSAVKLGYYSNQSEPVEVALRQFAPVDILLAADPANNTGAISGIVSDAVSSLPLGNAIVALYAVGSGAETVVRITKTNAGGLFLFGDVEAGTYRVKATFPGRA